jgi:hypothetical protein
MFLSPHELAELTGVEKKKPLQIEWLKNNNFPYTIKHTGEINVLRALVEQRHGMSSAVPKNTDAPNLGAFPKRRN